MKRIVAIAALLLSVTGCHKQPTAARPLKVGVIAVLTGEMAPSGQSFRSAIEVAAEHERAAGRSVELVFEDDALQPSRSAAAARKLLDVDKVDAIISFSSPTANVVAPLTARAGVPHLAVASDPKSAASEFTLVNLTAPPQEGEALAAELKRRGIKTAALFGMKMSGVDAVFAALEPALKKESVDIVWRDSYNGGEKDFRVKLAKMAAAKPQIAVIEAFTPELDLILKQARESAPGVELTSVEAFDYVGDRTLVEGRWMVTVSLGEPKFRDWMIKATGKEPLSCAAFGYDSLRLLGKAFEVSRGDRRAAYDWLTRVNGYEGAVGKLSFDARRVAVAPAMLVEFKNGLCRPLVTEVRQ